MIPSDEELIRGVQKGSESDFKMLYDRYKTPLFNFLYHFLGERQAAEDCLQDVFIRIYKKAHRYQPTSKLSSWLYAMARNAALDLLRKMKVRRAFSLDAPVEIESEASLGDLIKSETPDARSASISRESAEAIHSAIAQLEPADRQVLILCDIQEMPYKEVGEVLGFSAETIAVKLFRARQKLAGILKVEGEGPDE